jgi:hypothetical protein
MCVLRFCIRLRSCVSPGRTSGGAATDRPGRSLSSASEDSDRVERDGNEMYLAIELIADAADSVGCRHTIPADLVNHSD